MNRRGFFALLAGAGIAPKLLAAAKSPAIAQQLPFPVPRPRPGMPQWYEWSAFPRPVEPETPNAPLGGEEQTLLTNAISAFQSATYRRAVPSDPPP